MTGIVWLASYPKSGNTWLRLFLTSLAAGGKPVDINGQDLFAPQAYSRPFFAASLDVEASDLTEAEIEDVQPELCRQDVARGTQALFRKTHDAWRLTSAGEPIFPAETTTGAIYIVRDPRDVAVSLSHHLDRSIDETIALMANPQGMLSRQRYHLTVQLPVRLLSWSSHVASWLDAPGLNLLLLHYEDMLAAPDQALPAAAQFAQIPASPDALVGALAASRFDTLRSQEDDGGFRERPHHMTRFFRQGRAGGWRETLSRAQAARIESDHAAIMTRLGYS